MLYSYEYPKPVRDFAAGRFGTINVDEAHLIQTHDELLNRLDVPGKTFSRRLEVDAPIETVWDVAGSSLSRFFSHTPTFAGLTELNSLGSDEGGRYVIHRVIDGRNEDRIGEVLVNLPLSQLTASDIEIADPSVSGAFPTLHTLRLAEHPMDAGKSIVEMTCTLLMIARPRAQCSVALQALSIQSQAEELWHAKH